jgi:hypothetical protein
VDTAACLVLTGVRPLISDNSVSLCLCLPPFDNSETIFIIPQSNSFVRSEPSYSITSREKCFCLGLLPLFESELREFGILIFVSLSASVANLSQSFAMTARKPSRQFSPACYRLLHLQASSIKKPISPSWPTTVHASHSIRPVSSI